MTTLTPLCGLLVVTTIFCGSHGAGLRGELENELRPTLDKLLDSIEKLMIFFSKRFRKLNVDGLFGIRSLEGEFQRALEKGASGEYPEMQDPVIRDRVEKILEMAQETSKRAMPAVKKADVKYYQDFLPIIDSAWRMVEVEPQLVHKVNDNELPMVKNLNDSAETEEFVEEESDKCMGSLLGKQGYKPCEVDACWSMMTDLGSRLYHTTHQLLWFQLGFKAGCRSKLEKRAQKEFGGLEQILTKLCNNVIFTMEAISTNCFKGQNLYQDIFMEQGFICGGMGFMDAVRPQWLKEAASWQDDVIGCFKEEEDQEEQLVGEFEMLIIKKKEDWKRRKLLMDADMGDSCSAHKSAVALGYLAVHTRLFLDPAYYKTKLMPYLYGDSYPKPFAIHRKNLLIIGFFLLLAFFLFSRLRLRTFSRLLRPCRFG